MDGFRPGSFDVRSVVLTPAAGGVEIRVTFAVAPDLVDIRTARDLPKRAFLPVVDLYAASPPVKPGHGHTEVLPGRRVAVADGFGWDRGVILTSVPEALRAHYERVAPRLMPDICIPAGATLTGKTLRVHVPTGCLQSDLRHAGYLVLVTALGHGAGLGRFVRHLEAPASPDAEDPMVRAVTPGVGVCNVWEDGVGVSPCTIGGCKRCAWHPFVLDAIVPASMDQAELLGAFDAAKKRLASLPLVFPGGVAPMPAPPAPPPERYPVTAWRGRELTVRIDLPEGTMKSRFPAGTLGAILCPGERPGGTAVVRGVAAGFLVLERVVDDPPPCENARIEF